MNTHQWIPSVISCGVRTGEVEELESEEFEVDGGKVAVLFRL